MNISASAKLRVVSGVSKLAFCATIAGVAQAQAQVAPAPLASAPTPTPPPIPANVQECTLTGSAVTCAPGTDSDGFIDLTDDPFTFDVQTGAYLRRPVLFLGTANGTVNGTIRSLGDFAGAVVAGGDGSTVINNGFIQTDGDSSNGIEVTTNASVTNNGVIYTTGDFFANGVILGEGSSFTNNALVQTAGSEAMGVYANGDNVTVVNSISGSIITSGFGSPAMLLLDGANVQNDGLIQTFGDFSIGIDTQEEGTIVNNGNIVTSGFNSIGIGIRSLASFTNNSTGLLATSGDRAIGVAMIEDSQTVNHGTIRTSGDRAYGVRGFSRSMIINSGTIETSGDDESDGIWLRENSTVSNSGLIQTSGDGSAAIRGFGNDVEVTNSLDGVIRSSGEGSDAIILQQGGILTNQGLVSASGTGNSTALHFLGDGTINNSGDIISTHYRAVSGDGAVDLTNSASGSISSGNGDAVVISGNGAVVANSGLIEALNGTALGLSGGTLTNAGILRGDLALANAAGNLTFTNTGLIEGTGGIAAALGTGNDSYTQGPGGSVIGDIAMGSGDDTFILQTLLSTIDGTVIGGDGFDTAILGGVLDTDDLDGFELLTLGTQSALVIDGDRTLDGDIVVDGEILLALGQDSLATSGSITLENTGTVTISTPFDYDLIGQTVNVLQEGTVFTDNGATINILDDDLLLDYTPVAGSLAVQVSAANELAGSSDGNIVSFGHALAAAVDAGNLSQANFDLLSALGTATALEGAAADALPNLSEGAAREVFESSASASEVLNRHLASGHSGVWGQFIYRSADRDGESLSTGGYSSDQTVFTIGGDLAVGEAGNLGVLVSYADIENDDLGIGGALRGSSQIESYKFGLYGAVNFAERGFVNGELSYLSGEVESSRSGALGVIASSYDLDGFAYQIVAGYDLIEGEEIWVTPSVGLTGASISFDDTVETGGFDFSVTREDADFTELRGGVELGGQLSKGFAGFIRGTYVNDMGDDTRAVTVNSAELDTIDLSVVPRGSDRFELALGAQVEAGENFTIGFGYHGEFASGYDGHSGRITARFAF